VTLEVMCLEDVDLYADGTYVTIGLRRTAYSQVFSQ